MSDKELDVILNAISDHLKREKVFIQDPKRMHEIARAMEIAQTLFPDHTTEIDDDPLQTGALILRIECTEVDASIVVSGEREIELFNEMIEKANNFEIYQLNGNIRFCAVFQGALKML